MQLSNDILNKFAKTVDQTPEKTPVLEFNGVVTELPTGQNGLAEDTCKVRINAESTESEEIPTIQNEDCVCSTRGIDIIEIGNNVRIKMQNNEATIITNYDNPANVYNTILEISAEGVTITNKGPTRGYAYATLTSVEFNEKLNQGYKITGVNESYYMVRDGEHGEYVKPWELQTVDKMEIIPHVIIAAYNIEEIDSETKFNVLLSYVGSGIPGLQTYKIVFSVSLARPGILNPDE